MKCYAYLAWMRDDTLKVGHALDPFFRVRQGLTSSSNCFLCFQIEQPNKKAAQDLETFLKKALNIFRIKDAHCKEWFYSNKKGIKGAIIKALKGSDIEYAVGIGNKRNTTWDGLTNEQMKKVLKLLE